MLSVTSAASGFAGAARPPQVAAATLGTGTPLVPRKPSGPERDMVALRL
jgi:hypothetical protein